MRDLSETRTEPETAVASGEPGATDLRPIRSTILGVPSGILILLMFCAVIVAFGAVLSKVLFAERMAAQREISSVTRVFDTHKMFLLKEMERYAASNAAYLNIETDRSDDWIRRRFGVDMALDFEHDFTALIGRDQELLLALDIGTKHTNSHFAEHVEPQIADTLQKIRRNYVNALTLTDTGGLRFAGKIDDVSGVEVVDLNDEPHIAAAMAIVPDPGGIDMVNAPPSILVTTFAVDANHLRGLLASLSLDNLTFADTVPDGMIGVPLKTETGGVLGYLAWHPMSRASSIILSSLPILAIALVIILVVALIALRQNMKVKRDLALQEQEARFAATHDSLTGCVTRGYFHKAAAERLKILTARNRQAWLIYLDLDNLKQVNDIHGHTVGDSLIGCQADRVREVFGPSGLIGRIGGDEFLVLTEDWQTEDELRHQMDRLRDGLLQPFECDGKRLDTSVSAGIAHYPDHGHSLTELVRAADIALQQSKRERKSVFRVYDQHMDESQREKREMRIELDTALRDEELEVFYQPVVEATSQKISFYEALVRWRHPKRGLVSPGLFLPVAQDAGLMPQIGIWVLERSLRDASTWKSAGVSVNVCTSQIEKQGFAQQVGALLRKYNYPPHRLILEITEDLMLDANPATQEVFDQLRALGIELAIDDFGTGYSSLSYLHKFRFDKMKIDRSFIWRIGQDAEADVLVRSLIGLAKVMGMETVGEGVETKEQRDFLVKAGCGHLQGFLYGKPEPLKASETAQSKKSATG